MENVSTPPGRTGRALLTDALRHRLLPFLGVAVGVAAAVIIMVVAAPLRYDATSIVGFTPGPNATVAGDVVRLAASQFAAAASDRAVLTAAEKAAGVPAGTLLAGDVHAEQVPDTGLVQLVVSDRNPQTAADLANALAVILAARAAPRQLHGEVVRRADAPTSPAAPARGLYAGSGVLAGIGIGLVFVLALETYRPRVRNSAQLASIMGVPTVANLQPRSADDPPIQEMRLAQQRVSRTGAGFGCDSDSDKSGARVALLAAGQVTQHELNWVSAGLAGAFANSGHHVRLADPGADVRYTSAWPGGSSTVCVLPVDADPSASAPAGDQSLPQVIVVVRKNEPVPTIDQLRHDLGAANIEVLASVLINGSID